MLAEHQRAAVERAIELLHCRGGLLLADEVGLGKSYVAAEVMRRFEGMCELIVPASLKAQWCATLQDFEVQAPIVTHDGILADPFLPTPGRRLVVVDEAHAFRNPRTQRYAALARRTIASRVLLVSATPVCNSASDLEALLRLFARDDLLADAGVPSIDMAFALRDRLAIERIVAALVIRRDRSVLTPDMQFGELERRVVLHPVFEVPVLDELRFPLLSDSAIVRSFLRRRLESSEAALLESVRRQIRFYERALAAIAAGRTLPKRDYRNAFAHEEDRSAFQEVLFWELFAPPGHADPEAIRDELRRLERVIACVRESPCTKRAMLLALVRDTKHPTLVFTGSIATAHDLRRALGCAVVTSRDRSRDDVLRDFATGRIDVVVSTDMAAEGLNLQRAGTIVHYDLPWNPVKLDQRNGRAYRIGQRRPVVRAVYFVPRSRETKIAETIARKNRIRRRTLRAEASVIQAMPTLRPRLDSSSAYLALRRVAGDLPAILARRHKAGVELLMEEMSREFLDRRRLEELLALVEAEV